MHLIAMGLIFGLTIGYTIFAAVSSRVPSEKRTMWVILLILGGIVAIPIFYFIYVWRDPASSGDNKPPVEEAVS